MLRGGSSRGKHLRSVEIFFRVGAMLAIFSLLGASWLRFVPLAAFAVALARFFRILGWPGLDFGGSRTLFGGSEPAFFCDFSHYHTNMVDMLQMQQNHSFC